jgi:PAS domain S-box-containing protein
MTETDSESPLVPAKAQAEGNGGSGPSLDAGAALAWRYEQLHALHEMTEAVSRADDVEGIYDVALDGLTRALRAGRASILLFDQAGVMRFRAWRGLSDDYRAAVDGHSPWSPDSVDATPIVVSDAETDPSVEGLRNVLRREGIAALAFIPLLYRERLLGKFMIYYAEPHELAEDELRLAQTIANQVAFASQRKLEEEALRESRDQLAVIFRGVADGITVQDRTGKLVFANDAATHLLGFASAEELLESSAAAVMERFELYDEDGRPMSVADLPGRAALRGEDPPAQTIRWRTVANAEDHWSIVRSSPVLGEDGKVQFAVNIFHDVTDRKRSEERFRFLAEASEVLASSLDYQSTLQRVAGLAVPRFADWCTVNMLQPDGSIASLAIAHADPKKVAWAAELNRRYPTAADAETGLAAVVRSGEAEIIPEITDEMLELAARDPEHLKIVRSLQMRSYMGVPLIARGRSIGAIAFIGAESGRRYSEEDLALAQELAHRAAVAVDNSQLHRDVQDTAVLLDTLLDTAPVGFAFFDTQLRYVRLNEALAEIDGLPVDEHIGRTVEDVLPDLDPRLHEAFHEVLSSGAPIVEFEVGGQTPAQPGEERTWLASIYPVAGADGSILGLGIVVVEITDRVRLLEAEQDARGEAERARERLEFLAAASALLSSSLDYETTLESLARLAVPRLADCCVVDVVEWGKVHQVAVAHVDPTLEEFVRELERRYPADPDVERSPVGRVLRTGKAELLPDMAAHQKGIARDESHLRDLEALGLVSAMMVPLVVRGNTVGALTFLSGARRYTDQDLAAAVELADRAALAVDNARLYREAEERGHAARVLATVGDGVFLVDSRGVVRLWNPAAEAITGLAASELVGRSAAESIPGWDRIAEVTPVSDAPGPGKSRAESLPLDIDGRELWLSISGVGFSDGTVYAFRDLTDERRVEQLKTEFVATASHELRTPLAAVYGAAMTLRRPDIGSDPAVQARLLAVIAEESDRLARTINDILWASKLETGQLEVSIESFDIGESAAQIVEAMRAFISGNVSVELRESGSLPPVAGDPDKVRQVLTNLIDNAVKYSPDGGSVEVNVKRRDRHVRVTIRDEGLGIPPSEQARIFEKFYRLDPNLTRGVGGTGLGLYICRELVRRMDGRIWVKSAEGEGSTFFFELPLADT